MREGVSPPAPAPIGRYAPQWNLSQSTVLATPLSTSPEPRLGFEIHGSSTVIYMWKSMYNDVISTAPPLPPYFPSNIDPT